MKARVLALLALIAGDADSANGQRRELIPPFTSREQFLEASLADVQARSGAITLMDSSAIDRLASKLMPGLESMFGQRPIVFWATEGGGTFARADAIGVDRSQVIKLRSALGMEWFPDLLDFVLAHEFAHVAQFNRPEAVIRAGRANSRARECEADMWAGIRAEEILSGSETSGSGSSSPIRPDWLPSSVAGAFSRLLTMTAIAYELGHPAWYGASASHPTQMERRGCALQGFQIGQQRRAVRRYSTEADSAMKVHYASRVIDTALFDGDVGTWATTWHYATRLAAARPKPAQVATAKALVDAFVELLSAASVSGDALVRVKMPEGLLGGGKCEFTSSAKAATYTCTHREVAWSQKMYVDFWDGMHSLVKLTAKVAGWESVKWTERPSWFDEWAPADLGRNGVRSGGLVSIRGNNGFTGERFVEVTVTSRFASDSLP